MLVVGGAIMGILLFLLASASDNSNFFDEHYPWLLGLNVLVATALLVLISVLLVRLYRRYRRGRFGSRLMVRLVLLFATIGILPGVVIYAVSVQFVSRSIESWFDVRVESALDSGVKLGQVVLDSASNELNAKAHRMAQELAGQTPVAQTTRLSQLRAENQLQEAVIVAANGQVVATASNELSPLSPDLPTPSMLLQARMTSGFSMIEGGSDPNGGGIQAEVPLRLRVVVAMPGAATSLSMEGESYYLQLIQLVPKSLATNAEALRAAYSEYKTRSIGRAGLRKIYLVTLSLTLLLAIFGAVASAFMIASNLARPLLLLAQGTKAVAEGDLSPRPIIASPDELGLLTQSFNSMTRQLSDARTTAEKTRDELENAKIYLESVLANMFAGVMVLDSDFQLISCNESVERILQHEMQPHLGQALASIEGLSLFAAAVARAFSEQSAQSAADNKHDDLHWQQQIEIPRDADDPDETGHVIALLTRGSRLPVKNGMGYLVVFDDISDVISAQRSIAWGEVARRLAHEIKNPLTPIQLSAERLQMKLEGKLEEQEMAILSKSTSTIVNQVESMKRMVDDFRDYARTPPAVLEPLDLNPLIEEIIHLYTGGDGRSAIQMTLAPDLPQVMGDATQLRQIIHNLLQNAQDAVGDRKQDATTPQIDVKTEEIHYQNSDGKDCVAVRFSVVDNGPGFAARILAHAFEPYVTSKSRGTGLGLAMVKKIIDEHGGRIDIQNRAEGAGAKVSILLLKLASI
jgi:nitrogen fixation/metabolism regulation signal transduction histidine kinase